MKINFQKKYLLEIYFIFFIFLNIIDFLNIIGGDLDFFKKILSWTIISYLFYKVSITKIFTGNKNITIDILYIISFCFMTIPKYLILYSINIKEELLKNINELTITNLNIQNQNYYIFTKFIEFLKEIHIENLLIYSLIIGILISILATIFTLKKTNPTKKSLIGSFKFSEYQKFMKLNYLTLIFISIFFGFIIFNLFMEWFALAIDSIILIIGLIYYIFKYLHFHKIGKTSKLLTDISNTGNNFLINLIKLFSNKKTIFIGISFLLTIHLLVDFGVFLIPYSIGTENTLYFDQLNLVGKEHNPLFSVTDFSSSNFYEDISLTNKTPFEILGVFLIYIINISFLATLLIMPFYIFYKNVKKEKIKLNKELIIYFITSLFLLISLMLSNILNPIMLGTPTSSIKGVDIYTQNIFSTHTNFLIESIMIFFTIIIFSTIIFLTYNKIKIILKKITYYTILLFFVIYISIFFYSTIETEISNTLDRHIQKKNTIEDYNKINKNLQNEFILKKQRTNIELFVNKLDKVNHIDYLKINFQNFNYQNQYIIVLDVTNTYFSTNSFNYKTGEIKETNFSIIYKLGKNQLEINNENIIFNSKKIEYILNNKIKIGEAIIKNTPKINEFIISEYLRLILISIFYLFGTIEFIKYYFKKNLNN